MDTSDLAAEIESILADPEPDDDGNIGRVDWPHPRLIGRHGLDLSYLRSPDWEGSTFHPQTRICPTEAEAVHILTRNADVPFRLLQSALRLLGESIIAYHHQHNRTGPLRFYPPVILTLWSGFETFVRYSSRLLIATVQDVPSPVANVLTEVEPAVDRRGSVSNRSRYRPVLDRYALLLKYGYGHDVEFGAADWQRLEKAQGLRDYYTHLDLGEPRSVSTQQVVEYIEDVLVGIIAPSARVRRTLIRDVYLLYHAWHALSELAVEFVEQPFMTEWEVGGMPYMFYCPFDNVNTDKFPNLEQDIARRSATSAPRRRSSRSQ